MGIRILVADDEPDLLETLSERLRWLGHDVTAVTDGQAALAALEAHPHDLAFLDVAMPKLSGLEALDRIRRRWPDLPVIILTAHGTIGLAVDAMKIGAVDFLTKPFQPSHLESVIGKALEQSQLRDEITHLLGEISHDVKNLLMPIVTGTGLLKNEIEDLFKTLPELEQVRTEASHQLCTEVIDILRNTSERIHSRMKGIADYVAVSRTPHKFEPCDVATVAASVLKSLSVVAEQAQVTIRVEGIELLPPIMADENRLYSALYNLVHNAIPEVPSGGSITIGGRRDDPTDYLVLTVRDTGKGMPPSVRDSLFTVRAVSRKSGGTGLGLKIVKDAVDVHRGRISVESQEGQGTTFSIRLPIHQSSFAEASASPA